MNLRFVDLRLGDSLAVMLSGQVQCWASKDWARRSASCEDSGPGAATMRSSICLRTRQQFPRATGFSRNLCFLMEPDQPGQTSTLELLHQRAEICDECVAFFQREWQANIMQELPAVATFS